MHPSHPRVLPPQVEEVETVEVVIEVNPAVPAVNAKTQRRRQNRQRKAATKAAAKRAAPRTSGPYHQRSFKRSVHHRLNDSRWTTTSSMVQSSGPSTSYANQQWGAGHFPSSIPSASTSAQPPIPPPETWTVQDHNRAIQLATDRLMTAAAKEHLDDVKALVKITRKRGMVAAEAGEIREVELMGKRWSSNAMITLNAPNPNEAIPFPELIGTLPQYPHP
ncbi:unnamed protein product [Rotaria magnacalcarata]|uniref:Uncharacterized protein n=1 Tax=Rotaria magnacalcarata TaxID=392030 RepID=A0A820KFF8_9BILA|nr:unnamed protein product [Rotaria magnacalcarata]CAF4343248.1 unnamed protein product [Rotaria magnacalcarata]